MRVLMVCDHFPTYGTRSVLTLAKHLSDEGHQVCIASTSVGLNGERLGNSDAWPFKVVRFPSIHIPRTPYSYTPNASIHLTDLAKAFDPDVVHTHFIMYWLSLASSHLASLGYPLALSLHGFTLPTEPSVWPSGIALDFLYMTKGASLARASKPIIAVSKQVQEKFSLTYPELTNRTEIVPIGICPEEIKKRLHKNRTEVREAIGIEDKVAFIFVGRIVRDKGVFELVQAFKHLRRKSEDVALLLVGDGDAITQIQRFASHIPDIHIIGFKPDVGTYLAASDIFVLPSYREGLPTALLEGMYFRLPFIATPVGGIAEVIGNGASGAIIPRKNVTELFETMRDMSRLNSSELEQMGENNRLVVLKEYSWSRIVRRLITIYQKMLV